VPKAIKEFFVRTAVMATQELGPSSATNALTTF